MSVAHLINEAEDIDERSIRFARGISEASTGERLGRIMTDCMGEHPGAYASVRAAVAERVDALGGAGEAIGLFMLAADTATTSALPHKELTDADRSNLRQLWNDLRSQ
jgi:hypothetical protein